MSTVASQSPVPLCDLRPQHELLCLEIREAMEEVLQSQRFIMGPQVPQLEEKVAQYCGAECAVACSSGSDALLLALTALDVGPGDEVITTPFTFFATAGAISRLGAKAVFVDIEADGFNIDADKIDAAVTPRTKAIIPVHLFGQTAEMEPILEIARRHSLAIVEDAAQAIGAEYDGRRAGSMGTIGCLSFFPSKNLGGLGDGGLVTTNDGDLADKMKALRAHGAKQKYYHAMVGGNFRLDTIHAAVLLVKLAHLDNWNAARREAADRYRELFSRTGLAERLVLPPELLRRKHVYNQFCIRSDRRDELADYLRASQIGTAIYYPLPLHLQKCFSDLGYCEGDFPVSEQAAREILALPMFPDLNEEQQQRVVGRIGDRVFDAEIRSKGAGAGYALRDARHRLQDTGEEGQRRKVVS